MRGCASLAQDAFGLVNTGKEKKWHSRFTECSAISQGASSKLTDDVVPLQRWIAADPARKGRR